MKIRSQNSPSSCSSALRLREIFIRAKALLAYGGRLLRFLPRPGCGRRERSVGHRDAFDLLHEIVRKRLAADG